MKELILEMFDIEVCTVNNAYYRNGNRTKEARAYSESVHRELIKYSSDIDHFKESFSITPDNLKALEVEIDILVPQSRMYTKAGSIHKNSIDIDNYLKLLIDAVMDSRYDGRDFYDGDGIIKNVNINDKFITKLTATKAENFNTDTEKWDIRFTIKII